MQVKDSRRVPASQDKVWAGLNDPDTLKKCITGCQRFERAAPNEMVVSVTVRLGPVKASFGGKLTLSDIDAPNGCRLSAEGSGGVMGFAKGGATIRLMAEGPEATRVDYVVDAEIGGRLAHFGGRLIGTTAKHLAGVFFERFALVLAPPSAAGLDRPAKKGWIGKLIS